MTSRTVSRARLARRRALVHIGLIATSAVSLVLEPTLTLHAAFGFAFIALVVAHLAQRRRTVALLLGRLATPLSISAGERLALSDAFLTALAVGMLTSGLWDWLTGHPTRVRWHAITGVVLTGYLLVHTLRRARRLGDSGIR